MSKEQNLPVLLRPARKKILKNQHARSGCKRNWAQPEACFIPKAAKRLRHHAKSKLLLNW
jgi:hypothetical protein